MKTQFSKDSSEVFREIFAAFDISQGGREAEYIDKWGCPGKEVAA